MRTYAHRTRRHRCQVSPLCSFLGRVPAKIGIFRSCRSAMISLSGLFDQRPPSRFGTSASGWAEWPFRGTEETLIALVARTPRPADPSPGHRFATVRRAAARPSPGTPARAHSSACSLFLRRRRIDDRYTDWTLGTAFRSGMIDAL